MLLPTAIAPMGFQHTHTAPPTIYCSCCLYLLYALHTGLSARLVHLDLSVRSLTDEDLCGVVSRCGRRLRHLRLWDCAQLTNASLLEVARSCPE